MLALRDLAQHCVDGEIPTLGRLARMDDDEIVERLTAVRGIGRWTAEMFLIFRLGRPDVLPVDDYGVRQGFALAFGQPEPPSTEGARRARRAVAPLPQRGQLVPLAAARHSLEHSSQALSSTRRAT